MERLKLNPDQELDDILSEPLKRYKEGDLTAKEVLNILKGEEKTPNLIYFQGSVMLRVIDNKVAFQLEGFMGSGDNPKKLSVLLEIDKDSQGKTVIIIAGTREKGLPESTPAEQNNPWLTKTDLTRSIAAWATVQDEHIQEMVVEWLPLYSSVKLETN